jgi:hypothetical protein
MTRLRGRCARGQRLIAKVPHGRRQTLTFVAGLRCDGVIAPCMFDGPIDGESFLACDGPNDLDPHGLRYKTCASRESTV